MNNRIEKDSLGEVEVPENAYYGAQTARSIENFNIARSTDRMPKEIIYALAIVKRASALANAELTDLPKEKAQIICRVCDEILEGSLDGEFPLVIWQTGSGTQTNMNINEVIANRGHYINGGALNDKEKILHPNDDVNKSQSSNDVFPTAMNVSALKKLEEVTLPSIKKLRDSIAKKSKKYSDIVKLGRTHMMDATPITLGQELSGYVSQLDHGIRTIENSLPHLRELALGATAVGTGLNVPKGFAENAIKKIAKHTGLPFVTAENKFESLASNDAIVEAHGALKTIAVSLMKIANDIRFLSSGPRGGIAEIKIPDNEPGSSIMPGKVNPTQCEALAMICAQVMGNDVAISVGGMNGQLELNTYKPMMISNFLHSATLLGDGCVSFAEKCIDGLEPIEKNIKKNLDNSLMLVTALVPKIGYDKASEIGRKAHAEGTTLKEATLALGYATEKEFDEIVDPRKMV
ncbi:MAG: class II fumarate hydratase [Candidatus Pacebacteria bacterium]|nr:class II fumarate hydratase [Candidatus Paceibacterota bacterium]